MSYNQYDEGIASRSAQFRGGAVGGNVANGALPGNSNTAAGGDQVIVTSTNIDGKSTLDTPRSTNNISDDPKAYASSNISPAFIGQSAIGGLTDNTNIQWTQTSGVGLHTFSLGTTQAFGINSVSWSGVTYPVSGTVANASGAGYAFSGQSIIWNNGTYNNYAVPVASGWVPASGSYFTVNYSYSGTVINDKITSILSLSRQNAFLGNAGQSLGASSSFGGPDITR